MSQDQELFALDWIKSDLLETLDNAKVALEAFSESEQDETRMRACLTSLHQVHGTLVMLELPGVALLADHLERLAQALLNQTVTDTDSAVQNVMQGILELPGYIDAIQEGEADSERPMLPLANEIRIHLRLEPLKVPAGNILAGTATDAAVARFERIDGLTKARKIRSAYQQVLLSILKGDDRQKAVATLGKVAQSLYRICEETPHAGQWQAFGEFIASLERQTGPLDPEAIKLLRRVDAEIRGLATMGAQSLQQPVNRELVDQLLAQAEQREHSSAVLVDLKGALSEAAPVNSLVISGRQALASAALALRDEVSVLKDRLDLDVRSEAPSKESFTAIIDPLTQIGSTLSLLGFQSSHATIFDQVEALNDCVLKQEFDQETLMSVADALVQVDENLAGATQGMRGQGEVERITSDAHRSVANEARAELEGVKTAIVDYVSSGWDYSNLSEVPAALDEVCGALDMIPLARPARQLGECRRYVVDVLPNHNPDWQSLDHLADAISGVDYYLERIVESSSTGTDRVLDLVDRSLSALDYTVEAPAEESSEDVSITVEAVEEQAQLIHNEHVIDEGAVDDEQVDAELPALGVEADAEPEPEAELEAELGIAAEVVADDSTARDSTLVLGVDELPLDEETAFAAQSLGDAPDDGFDLGGDDFEFPSVDELESELAAEPTPEPEQEPEPEPEPELEAGLELEPEPEFEQAAEADTQAGVRDAAVAAIAAAAVTGVVAGLADEHQGDDEIAEIFLEEAAEVVDQIDHWLPEWRGDLAREEALIELRRAFHTLKGSGRMVGANVVGALAWSVENMLNRVVEDAVPATDQFVDVTQSARELVPALLHSFEQQQVPELAPVGQLIEAADLLASGGTLEQSDSAAAEMHADAEDAVADSELEIPVELPEAAEPAEEIFSEAPEDELQPEQTLEEMLEFDDSDALIIFADEAREHLDTLRASMTSDLFDANEDAVRALHTLAGAAGIAGADEILVITRPAYELARAYRTEQNVDRVDEALAVRLASFMHEYVDQLSDYVEVLSHGGEAALSSELVGTATALLNELGTVNRAQELLAIDGIGQLFEAVEYLEQWHSSGQDLEFAENLSGTLARLTDQAHALEHNELAGFAHTLNSAHLHLQDMPLSSAATQTLQQAHEQLLQYLDALVADQEPASIDLCLADVAALLELELPAPAADELLDIESAQFDDESDSIEDDQATAELEFDDSFDLDALGISEGVLTEARDQETPSPEAVGAVDAPAPTPAFENNVSESEVASAADKDFDMDIVEIFVEEAEELLESLDESFHELEKVPDNQLHMENVLRDLHTMKGGARLAAFTALGDLTHEFESQVLEQQAAGGGIDDAFVVVLYKRHDQLLTMVSDVKQRLEAGGVGIARSTAVVGVAGAQSADAEVVQTDQEVPAALESAAESESVEQQQVTDQAEPDNVVPLVATGAASPKPATVAPPQASERQVTERAPQEMVRVGAGLLEELVNLAGESSIVRARIEQGLGDFTVALDEMETTIGRVREQLRRLEIETEAQILFRQERLDTPSHEGFDPLEMDRYSQLQQLSKSLSESASDMLDLKDTLLYKARESETLLIQQARINTELQEGLMRTRMVPFSRLLPRLRRTVRQVGGELGKDVEFNAFNAEGELDRNLLERMIPPLEHMLRNAVDHGIEIPAERRAFGKNETGQIELRLSREGGDVLIEISDDGAGIDVESVRAKAVERGLMSPDAQLRDDEVLQFVLAPGFTTAKSVTQISGRGVGMDVVHSEVKQLGGSISIASQTGKGTRFALRVPFTVSVNRALMVSVGDDLYAIPLNTIEGIVLLGPQELEKLYAPGANPFEYAGMSYHVRYLGHFLGREYRGNVSQGSAPVVLVRSGDQSIAVHVDSVQGSREIVVKSLGPQFAGVGGISGATILGDGSVVVILDLLALIRTRGEQPVAAIRRQVAMDTKTRCVMVVDDSVTVRKVTSRLLERQGMDVLVAKDGVEAVAMLQERRPDILLLDIEMPRMDGFEVARQVRHDDHLEGLPIVMISSRTGEKHQERATGLGVNRFLGKPFQESELLETIDQLVKS